MTQPMAAVSRAELAAAGRRKLDQYRRRKAGAPGDEPLSGAAAVVVPPAPTASAPGLPTASTPATTTWQASTFAPSFESQAACSFAPAELASSPASSPPTSRPLPGAGGAAFRPSASLFAPSSTPWAGSDAAAEASSLPASRVRCERIRLVSDPALAGRPSTVTDVSLLREEAESSELESTAAGQGPDPGGAVGPEPLRMGTSDEPLVQEPALADSGRALAESPASEAPASGAEHRTLAGGPSPWLGAGSSAALKFDLGGPSAAAGASSSSSSFLPSSTPPLPARPPWLPPLPPSASASSSPRQPPPAPPGPPPARASSRVRREEFAALEAHIEELTAEKFALQRGLDRAQASLASLASEHERLAQSGNWHAAHAEQLGAQVARARAEARASREESAALRLDASHSRERVASLAAEVVALEEASVALRAEAARARLGAAGGAEAAQGRARESAREAEAAQGRARESDREARAAGARAAAAEGDVAALREEGAALKARLRELMREMEGARAWEERAAEAEERADRAEAMLEARAREGEPTKEIFAGRPDLSMEGDHLRGKHLESVRTSDHRLQTASPVRQSDPGTPDGSGEDAAEDSPSGPLAFVPGALRALVPESLMVLEEAPAGEGAALPFVVESAALAQRLAAIVALLDELQRRGERDRRAAAAAQTQVRALLLERDALRRELASQQRKLEIALQRGGGV